MASDSAVDYTLVSCSLAEHGEAILEILNDAIVNSTAVYDYEPRPSSSMDAWFATKHSAGFPVIGVAGVDGTLLGFATYGTFRAWPAYKYTVEHSIYVHRDYRGAGLGNVLLQAIIDAAEANGMHAIIGGIDASNAGSIALHEKFGFAHVGTLPEVGFKFDRWLDLAFYQLTLSTPAEPTAN